MLRIKDIALGFLAGCALIIGGTILANVLALRKISQGTEPGYTHDYSITR